MSCTHPGFDTLTTVRRILRAEQGAGLWFIADVQVACSVCREPFAFLGLPTGFDLHGAAASIDGSVAHLAIAPLHHEVTTRLDPKLGRVTVRRPA